MSELNIVERVIALEGVELLHNLGPEQLARIGAIAKCPTDPTTNKPKLPEADKHCDSVPGMTLLGGNTF